MDLRSRLAPKLQRLSPEVREVLEALIAEIEGQQGGTTGPGTPAEPSPKPQHDDGRGSQTRIVLVTGAAQGIGLATVRLFLEEGWTVVGWDVRPIPLEPSETFWPMQVDVAQPDQVAQAMDAVGQRFGRLDALVNNAAVQITGPLVETTPEAWDRLMAVNLKGVYLVARAAYPWLRAAGRAAVVNVASVHALATSAHIGAYAASKGGVLALTRAMAIEWAPEIRVNAVLPGAVDTPMLRAGLQRGHFTGEDVEARMQALARRTVAQRVARPEEIAQAILFLADHRRSSFIYGHGLVVDGGATIRLSTE